MRRVLHGLSMVLLAVVPLLPGQALAERGGWQGRGDHGFAHRRFQHGFGHHGGRFHGHGFWHRRHFRHHHFSGHHGFRHPHFRHGFEPGWHWNGYGWVWVPGRTWW
jgi:hypothetical protein